MSTGDLVKFLREAVHWLIMATVMGVPFICSLYVLVTPRHKLLEAWQNYKMRSTRKVLKDQHFKNVPRFIGVAKFLSIFVFVFCGWTICWQLGIIDYWPPEQWWNTVTKYF